MIQILWETQMIKTDTERNRRSEYSHYMKETEFIIKTFIEENLRCK